MTFSSPHTRNCMSTETALLRVQNDIMRAIDSRCSVILVLLDLSPAFDTVDDSILLQRLSCRFVIKGKALSWFKSYITNRKQFVMVREGKSTSRDLFCGVPQGSVLGPILYLLCTSPLGDIVRFHGMCFHFYADDSQIYLSFESSSTVLSNIDKLIRSENTASRSVRFDKLIRSENTASRCASLCSIMGTYLI